MRFAAYIVLLIASPATLHSFGLFRDTSSYCPRSIAGLRLGAQDAGGDFDSTSMGSSRLSASISSDPEIIPSRTSTSQLGDVKLPDSKIARLQTPVLDTWKELNGLSERAFVAEEITDGALDSKALDLAFRRCEYVTQLFSKTFYTGTKLMAPEARKHVWAIYAWCRRTDDLVDSPRACLQDKDTLTQDLALWENRLDAIFAGQPMDLFDLAMVDTVRAYPDMSIVPFRDMIAGMVMDVPGLGQERYANFEELYLYCYRVAGTVGIMTLPLLGTAQQSSIEEATEPALALGIALQLTNILRDVGEDLERGRIYLPQDELAAFGLTEEDLFRREVTPKYKEFMKFQIQRARDYYKTAQDGVRTLSPSGRLAVQASLDLYSRILTVIERNDYDNFKKRAYTTKFEKLTILPASWSKIQSIKD